MLSFMGENKRLMNIYEQKFTELSAFQENITVFQANTNTSLKNLETQVGKLALITTQKVLFYTLIDAYFEPFLCSKQPN